MNTKLIKLLAVLGAVASLAACDSKVGSYGSHRNMPPSAQSGNFMVGAKTGELGARYNFNIQAIKDDWFRNGYKGGAVAWEEYTDNALVSVLVTPNLDTAVFTKDGILVRDVEVQRIPAQVQYEVRGNMVAATIHTQTGCVIHEQYDRMGNDVGVTVTAYGGNCTPDQTGALARSYARGTVKETLYR